jgi:carbon monoxide dehydrogenase subunit G
MVVRVERTVEVPATVEQVWAFISDPEKRSRPISVVEDYESLKDGKAAWQIRLPIPVVDTSVRVETEDQNRDPPNYVEFVGKSRLMGVVGEHELEACEGGTMLVNRFIVDGKLPGVERFFKRNMPEEFDNLIDSLHADLGIERPES